MAVTQAEGKIVESYKAPKVTQAEGKVGQSDSQGTKISK